MTDTAPVGIVAASGGLPLKLAAELQSRGRAVYIVSLDGMADADYSGHDHDSIRIGALSRIIDALKTRGCREIVLAGKFVRPRIATSFPDALASKIMVKLFTRGDNAALEMLADVLAGHGMTIIDKGEILGNHRAGEGVLAGAEPRDEAMVSINHARHVLETMSDFDIGQAVLVQGQRVIAIEAAEGTDMMLERCAGLIDPDLAPAVLVKMMKSAQSRHLDPPVIGCLTIEKAALAGVSVVAVETGGVLIADLDETLRMAEARGISLIGVGRS